MITIIMENTDADIINVPRNSWGRPSACLGMADQEALGDITGSTTSPGLGPHRFGLAPGLSEATTLPNFCWAYPGLSVA